MTGWSITPAINEQFFSLEVSSFRNDHKMDDLIFTLGLPLFSLCSVIPNIAPLFSDLEFHLFQKTPRGRLTMGNRKTPSLFLGFPPTLSSRFVLDKIFGTSINFGGNSFPNHNPSPIALALLVKNMTPKKHSRVEWGLGGGVKIFHDWPFQVVFILTGFVLHNRQ